MFANASLQAARHWIRAFCPLPYTGAHRQLWLAAVSVIYETYTPTHTCAQTQTDTYTHWYTQQKLLPSRQNSQFCSFVFCSRLAMTSSGFESFFAWSAVQQPNAFITNMVTLFWIILHYLHEKTHPSKQRPHYECPYFFMHPLGYIFY